VWDSPDPFLACLNTAWSVAFGDCCPNGEVVVVVGVAIAECGVIAEVRGCCNPGNVVVIVEPEMEATYFAETHRDFLPVEDSLRQRLGPEISPFDLVLWNLEGFPSLVFGQWGFAGVELANSLEQSSCVAVFAETLLTAEHCSVMSAGTAKPVLMEAHRAYQLAEGRYWTEVLHGVVSNGDLGIHCFGRVAN
jgi:hypothetical protein